MSVPKTTTFKIFVPLLRATQELDGSKRLQGVASSTIKDRHGDTMTVNALNDMERTASENMTIFLNHEYRVPEDVAGSVRSARISRSPQDPDIHDLAFDIVVNGTNERAVKAWEAINGGTKLGLSIGAMIPEGGAARNDEGAYTIDHVDLLETSLVGVPANPRSWVEYAVKALTSGESNGTMRMPDGEMLDLGEDGTELVAVGLSKEAEVPMEDEGLPDPDIEPVEIASTSAAATTTEDIPVEAVTDGTDKTDATVSVETEHAKITVDTGNRGKAPDGASQEAQESVPENEEKTDDGPWAEIGLSGEPSEDGIREALQLLEPTVTASLQTSTQLVAVLTRELGEAREQRDEALKSAFESLTLSQEILDAVAATPAGRRAVVPEAQKKLADQANGLKSVYGSEFVEELLRKDT